MLPSKWNIVLVFSSQNMTSVEFYKSLLFVHKTRNAFYGLNKNPAQVLGLNSKVKKSLKNKNSFQNQTSLLNNN